MLALSLSDKFCCFGIFVFVFVFNFFVFVFNRFLFFRFSFVFVFIIFFVLVLVFVNEFVIFSFFIISVFVFVNENHTGGKYVTRVEMRQLIDMPHSRCSAPDIKGNNDIGNISQYPPASTFPIVTTAVKHSAHHNSHTPFLQDNRQPL